VSLEIGLPFCKKCGRGIDRDSTFCKYCGASLAPAKPWIDPTLLVIVLLEIVFITALDLWSGTSTLHVFAIVGIVANVAIFAYDLVRRHAQRP
jgi:RNA polymerase subunit RPABC4/transcription elongation factor Spt4